jgi:hypothetical protein
VEKTDETSLKERGSMVKKQTVLERVKPEQVGVDSRGILHFLHLVEDKAINLHSFMLLRHGKVAVDAFYRPYNKNMLHPVYSVSKSLTSAAVGIAIGEGLLSLEDRVIDFFPEKAEEPVHPFCLHGQHAHSSRRPPDDSGCLVGSALPGLEGRGMGSG